MKKRNTIRNTASEEDQSSRISEPQQLYIDPTNVEPLPITNRIIIQAGNDAALLRGKIKHEFSCDEMLASITKDNFIPLEEWGVAGEEWKFDDDPKSIVAKK